MPLRYVLDENVRGLLWRAIERYNRRTGYPINAVRVGDLTELPRGTRDRDLLMWAERENSIIISLDVNTMPRHLHDHLESGHHSPGLFLLVGRMNLFALLEFLSLAAYASDPEEWRDRVEFVNC
jgi:hypothetical protein